MLARKLQHQTTSGAASDAGSSSLSVRSMPDTRAPPPPPPWWARWLAVDGFFQLANSFYARRMVLVTLTSSLSMVLLCVFADKTNFWIWIWILFQLTNSLLGVSALPGVQLFSPEKQAATPTLEAEDDDSEASDRQRRASLQKLEPFPLKRSRILRMCETIVVVQSVLLYLVLVATALTILLQRERMWNSSGYRRLFAPEAVIGALAVVCVLVQTKTFDQLRTHEQRQLGVGLDPELLDPPLSSTHQRGYSERVSTVLQSRESSRESLRLHRSRLESDSALSQEHHSDALDVSHAAGLVNEDLRSGLLDAAIHRDVAKATALLAVMEQVLGSKVKVELLLLKLYATPTLWLWSFAKSTANPLHVACRLGDAAMVRALLAGGMNPNLLDKTHGARLSLRLLYDLCQGRRKHLTHVLGTPLHVAVAHGHSHLVEPLVEHGASLDAMAQSSWFSKSQRVPPLFLADSVDLVSCLIHHGANFLLVPGKGSSMTISVLQRAKLSGRSDLEAVLTDWGADVALTPLHEAAAKGDLATVKHYLGWGIPPDQRGEFMDGVFQRTPLHWASIMGRRAVVAELVAHGADVHAVDRDGRSPLHWACRHNHIETIHELVDNSGADPQCVDAFGLTPLAFAAEGGLLSPATVALMVAKGVDVNATMANEAGDTCLHLALRQGHHDAALALVTSGGADLMQVNGEGRRAVECCASSELQFAVKEASHWVDVVLSYDGPYRSLAERVKRGLEASYLTVFLRAETPEDEGPNSMDVLRGASAVVCLLSPGFEKSAVCMEELAFAKLLRVPVVALTTTPSVGTLPEELQVYLFTRQLVALSVAVSTRADGSLAFSVDDDAQFQRSVQHVVDGLRDQVERHRVGGRGGGEEEGGAAEDEEGTRSVALSIDNVLRHTGTSSVATDLSEPHKPHRSLQDVVDDVLLQRRLQDQRRTSLAALPSLSVFLSHGDCHKELVARLGDALRRQDNVHVTIDSMAKVSGLKERILAAKDAILQCDVLLVVLSAKSVQTELVNDQLAFAEDKGKHIVPIHVTRRPSVVTSALRDRLDQCSSYPVHVLADDFTYGRGLDELLQLLRRPEKEKERESSVVLGRRSELPPVARRLAQRLASRVSTKAKTTVPSSSSMEF